MTRRRTFQPGMAEHRKRRKQAAVWIGSRIRRRRTRLGLTQKQVAGDVFTGAYISAIERGLTAPSLSSLLLLSTALHVRPVYFLEGLEIQ